uniref:Uncharacterized protein n=1 Tax=Oryza brachyantha TaxID=4533 RepID=J3N0N4_ORYBR
MCGSHDFIVTTMTSACIRRSYKNFFTSAFSSSASVSSSAMQNTWILQLSKLSFFAKSASFG